jgi:DNA-nicking Smr family endonuclease
MNSERRSRRRPLTAEEAELWAYATRDTRRAIYKRRAEAAPENESVPAMKADATQKPSQSKTDGAESSSPRPYVNASAKPAPPPLAAFDERQRRKLSREPDLIDARLDLHGMRQREAHGALRGFLLACASRGDRHVLIITGKGAREDRERGRDFFAEERGVLRRLVPQWLGEPDLRHAVVSFTTASPRHGGEGALYIRLRKRRGHV